MVLFLSKMAFHGTSPRMKASLTLTCLILLDLSLVISVNPDGSLFQKLKSQRDSLMQDGLSFFNGTTVAGVQNRSSGHDVRCLIHVENWTKWLLAKPVYYTKYGGVQRGFHEREVFPAHQELVIPVNVPDSSLTGSSGTIAWELQDKNVHVIVMWSIPYNLNVYNSYYGIGVVHISSRFTRDMLPFWYEEMIGNDQGRLFQRGRAGSPLVFRHADVFIMGNMGEGYQPVLNITVMPWSSKNLAPSVWHKLYLKSLKTGDYADPLSSCSVRLMMQYSVWFVIIQSCLLIKF